MIIEIAVKKKSSSKKQKNKKKKKIADFSYLIISTENKILPNSLGLGNKIKNRFADDSFENWNLENICYNIIKIPKIFCTTCESIKLLDGSVGQAFLIYEFKISSIYSEYCLTAPHFSNFFKLYNKEIPFWYLFLTIKS